MIRWIISPVVTVDIPSEEGGGSRRYPQLCYGDKYPCVQWGAVFLGDKSLVRFDVDEVLAINPADFIEELTTPEQWTVFYSVHPEMKNRWSDQP